MVGRAAGVVSGDVGGEQRAQHMVPRGLEPRTLRLLAVRSNQLSYETLALVAAFPSCLLLCFGSIARSACSIPMSRGGAIWSNRTGFATARLAQPAERKALNLVVVGSSPTVGVYTLLFGGRGARHGFCKHAPREARTPDLEVNSLTL